MGRRGSRANLVRLSKREVLARRMTATMTAMMALLAATALAPRVAEAQLLTPKEYRAVNVPPSSNGTLPVYTSALLERLLGIDDKKYQFTSIVFLYFSWEDPTAMDKMLAATDAYRNGSGECEFFLRRR